MGFNLGFKVLSMLGTNGLRQSEEEKPWDGRDHTVIFQVAVSFP